MYLLKRLMNENELSKLGIPLGPRKLILNELANSAFQKEMNDVKNKIRNNLESLNKQQEKDQLDQFNYGLAGLCSSFLLKVSFVEL